MIYYHDSEKNSNQKELDQLSSRIIGQRLGEFEIKNEIGRGGTSVVYEAYQPSLKRIVALKVLWLPFIKDASLIERFHHEAEAIANLHHPGIVPIYALGREKELLYFAMEKIEGKTLDDILESKKDIPLDEAIKIIKQVARILSYAHQQGVIHRDIKPSNIMIDKIGRILVADFGLVRSKRWKKITSTQTVLGTPLYMSPEQAEGKETDARSDIYSLGVVFYQMLTKKVPFDADDTIAILRKVIDEDPPEPRRINKNIPKKLETIILKCLEKDPNRRYQTMGVLLRDLELYQSGLPLIAKRSEISFFAKKRKGLFIKIVTFLALITTIMSGTILYYLYSKYSKKGFEESNLKQAKLESKREEVSLLPPQPESIELTPDLIEDLADIVYLKDGRKILGILEDMTEDRVVIRLKIGTVTYFRHQISSIEESTPEKRKRLKEYWNIKK